MSDWKSLISSEASAGISFSSVLIGIGTAIVGAAITSPPPIAIEIVLLSGTLILITGFYSAICYANTHGILRSVHATEERAVKPIIWGNALSEYFGVYLLNYTIPFLVLSYTNNALATRMTLTVIGISFLVYHLSNFDMLERIIRKRWIRAFMLFLSLSLVLTSLELVKEQQSIYALASFITLIFISVVLCILHIHSAEKTLNVEEIKLD